MFIRIRRGIVELGEKNHRLETRAARLLQKLDRSGIPARLYVVAFGGKTRRHFLRLLDAAGDHRQYAPPVTDFAVPLTVVDHKRCGVIVRLLYLT